MASEGTGCLIRFGAFEADLQAGELRKNGRKIRLQDQPFQVLAMLLERPGQVVTREELQRKLWPADTFVDFGTGLNRAINRLREALGDAADNPRFVETLPKRGYRFIAPVQSGGLTDSAPPLDFSQTADPQQAILQTANTARRPVARVWFAVLAILLLAGAAAFFLNGRPQVLTERDTVVLADFDNRTGDPAFDYTLKQALAINLGQSPFLKILSDQEATDTIRLMGRSPDQPITQDVARDLCRRTESKVALGGSITPLGAAYVIGLNAVNCLTGEIVIQKQVTTKRKEEVLQNLDGAAADLRSRLGESLTSIQKFSRPIQDVVSTSSFEAFQAFTDGQRMVVLKGIPTAIPFFQRALDLDPNFARAYGALGTMYGNMGESELSRLNTAKAYELRQRVSEWEKFQASKQYYIRVTGQIEKALEISRVWTQNYPRDWIPHDQLGQAYRQLGQYESSLSEYQAALRVGGNNPIVLAGIASAYRNLNRFAEAKAILDEPFAQNPDQLFFRQSVYLLDFLDDDSKAMQDHVAWAMHKPGTEDGLLAAQSQSEAYFGRLKKSRELSQLAVESAQRSGYRERAALWDATAAGVEAVFGNFEGARRHANAALELMPGQEVRIRAAMALARAADVVHARKLADQLNADFPLSSLVQNYWLPTIQAEIAVQNGAPQRAIELLRMTGSYELSEGSCLSAVYVRAEAYMRAQQPHLAAAEFEKILQHRGIVRNCTVGALAELGLARAHALAGDITKARTKYRNFLALWKDADSDVPVLQQARVEYARIK